MSSITPPDQTTGRVFEKLIIMDKLFMPEIKDPAEKLRLLRDNCDTSEEDNYVRQLTQEELDQRREQLADNCIEQNRLEDELDEIKKDYKGKIQPIKAENKHLLQTIKTRQEEKEGRLFNFFRHDEGMCYTYDEAGELVGSRRLKPDEKHNLFVIPSKAANDQ